MRALSYVLVFLLGVWLGRLLPEQGVATRPPVAVVPASIPADNSVQVSRPNVYNPTWFVPESVVRLPTAEPETSQSDLLDRIETWLNQGQLVKARKAVEATLAQHPRSIDAQLLAVRVYRAGGELEHALELAIELRGYAQSSHRHLEIEEIARSVADEALNVLSSRDDPAPKLRLLRTLVTQWPEESRYHYRLAETLFLFAEYDEALLHLQYALQDPTWHRSATELHRRVQRQLELAERFPKNISLLPMGNHFAVKVRVNDGGSTVLLIDTGASLSLLSKPVAGRLGLTVSAEPVLQLRTAGGLTLAHVADDIRLALAGYAVDDLRIAIADIDLDAPAEGLLGMDFLRHFHFRIEPQAAKLYLGEKP